MQYKFLVTIETDEANPDELEEAITDMLRVADMPNGDTLYIDHPVVEYMRPPGLDYERMMIVDAIEQFKTHGMAASYHYADDSGTEWGLGDAEKTKALAVFDANPDHQAKMREVAQGFLWAYDFTLKRPNAQGKARE